MSNRPRAQAEMDGGTHPKRRLSIPSAIVVIGSLSVVSWAAILSVILALGFAQ